ncbi:hypothetical protein [Sulfurimonas sp.]
MSSKFIFFLLLGLDALILFIETSHISISYNEALLLYGNFSFLQQITKFFIAIFGSNDLGLRFAMILFHLMSVVLMYLISKRYLHSERNRLWLVFIFILLPGVVSSALIVNHAGIIIFGLFLYIYLSDIFSLKYTNILLFLYAIIDPGFAYLFIGLLIYYLYTKNRLMAFYNLFLYIVAVNIYSIEVNGIPRGHLLDVLGIYSAIFTPIIFIYIFYVLYKRYLSDNIDKLWFISTTALLISLVLSFRQRIDIEEFAPYLIISLPLAAQTFVSSYRMRLKEHRKNYRLLFIISVVLLLLNTLVVFFNKELYLVIENPKKHFAYDMDVAKELSKVLKERDIHCVKSDYKMQLRLRFYGIKECSLYTLKELPLASTKANNVTISYKNKDIYKANVTKINNR